MRTLLIALFCLLGPSAYAEKYCSHPPTGLFGAEGDTKSITWEMTALSNRQEPGSVDCSREFVFAHGLFEPIQIMIKPKFLTARVENSNVLVVVPDKVGTDTMTIKILYKTRKGRARTGYVNYIIKSQGKAL
jgi:hypothetical protein